MSVNRPVSKSCACQTLKCHPVHGRITWKCRNAVAGDIIGFTIRIYQVGITLTVGKISLNLSRFNLTLKFSWRLQQNVMKQKSFTKGIAQLVQEGAIQLYTNWTDWWVHVGSCRSASVWSLQHRMENEYNAEVVSCYPWAKDCPLDFTRWSGRAYVLQPQYFSQGPLWPACLSLKMTLPCAGFADKYPDVKLEEKMWER